MIEVKAVADKQFLPIERRSDIVSALQPSGPTVYRSVNTFRVQVTLGRSVFLTKTVYPTKSGAVAAAKRIKEKFYAKANKAAEAEEG